MGDLFLAALAQELEKTQRALPSSCLFCVPQARSLVADEPVSQEDLFSHFLSPAGASDASDHVHRPGAYETLNGKSVTVVGSHLVTGKGFDERRKVRILMSEHREIQSQEIMVLHLSRPLVGGIVLPEDPNDIDVATFRRYTAMLRAFPENELVFLHLDETIAQAKKICRHNQFANRYESTLPKILKEDWEYAVEEIARGGSFTEADTDDENGMVVTRRQTVAPMTTHLLQIQQVVECYLMEQLHKYIFPRVMVSCRVDDEKLGRVLWQMRHYGPADFGLRKEFQCYLLEARNELVRVERKKTPLEMLLAFKKTIDHINEAITRNLQNHHHDLNGYQMTTDDVLDELLYVLLQVFNKAVEEAASEDPRETPHFPMVSVLKYVTDYHFINSNTSMLGYTIANFQVAIEYFLMKADHSQSCRVCYNIGSRRRADWKSWDEAEEEQCPQAIVPSAIQTAFTRNYSAWLEAKKRRSSLANVHGAVGRDRVQRLFILGDWSPDGSGHEEQVQGETSPVVEVELAREGAITQVSCGHRYFGVANDRGELLTWGDQSGGRLGYAPVQGDPRRVMQPRLVPSLEGRHVLQVSCGAFHTLVTDVNGHVYGWGQNARGQLGFLNHSQTTDVGTPAIVKDLKGVYISTVACGEYHSLALSSDGRVFSWGCNKFTKLGRRTEGLLDAVQPKPIKARWTSQSMNRAARVAGEDIGMPIGAVRRIAAGRDHSVAVTFDGATYTWGRGDQGQLGHGCYMDIPEPKQVVALADDMNMKVMDVSAGGNFTLFLLRDGAVFISGRDPSLTNTTKVELLVPELVEWSQSGEVKPEESLQELTFVGIAAGESHFALLSESGDVVSSPRETNYISHDADTVRSARRRLERVQGISHGTRIRAGASHCLILTAE